ncbi:MAG TPA: TetR/AcrR family transcriptional regulator [Geminicoccus sp.]|jgi:AcrR family transcriptional regulator|uniref:TetR/AcrR family transcriptional regulator n=1 Tax=Geminicoccus sp. TaxID=2024832 RepID=UPI002E346D76|nr:TetR/AcrR family transcriptional regulator [Geminicoccus sp.]HEX2526093.1 TetR/AcrR family transcriptional regulator [Geminicoccus sp.]
MDADGRNGNGGYPQTRATREDWLAAARAALIVAGVDHVKILPLAQRLEVSRSSFYWYFKDRRDLLDQLVGLWRDTNTRDIVEQARRPSGSITQGVLQVFECWTDEALFDPRLDFAIREWARRSPDLRRVVKEEDDARVEAIRQLFARHGYGESDAFIRARVLYFMQIGYYALELNEPREQRLCYTAEYVRSFTGQDPSTGDVEAFQRMVRQGTRRTD